MAPNFPPSKSLRGRTLNLLKMAGGLASQEILKRVSPGGTAKEPLFSLAQAQILTAQLGNLKGAAMKLGQMLALEARDYLPEEVCVVLDQLQSNVSYLAYATIEEIVRTELGMRWGDLSEFSRVPIAAASIGQVHTAKLASGESVAIKVQYPGIFESIQSDVKILSGMIKTLSIVMKKEMDLSPLVQEFSDIFVQESDYLQEASFTEQYGMHARNVDHLAVPTVYRRFTTSRVLTLSLMQGLKFSEWIKSPEATPEARLHYGELILDLYTREFCEWGLVQTDPNLGNFLFVPADRRLVLLDFGATKAYDLKFRKKYSQLIQAALDGNSPRVLVLSEEMGLLDPRESSEAKAVFKKLLFQSMEPITSDDYDFSDTNYPEEMKKLSRELVKALRYSPPPKDLIFLHRKLSGIFYILKQLKVKMSLRSYTKRFEALAAEV